MGITKTLFDDHLAARYLTANAQRGRECGIGTCHFPARHGEALAALLRGEATAAQRDDLERELELVESLNGSQP